ncbi:hypothetical protein [Acidocella sp. KAb 2-4]|uniref:hypothetical protein n=1 Tax=Acidocella sp. KAb 2-4 TaxID=2885158 RepID=UPI001D060BD1|nr:hypothetical protein [Acidocella sp. KAb 2-4]MCB5946067.1 hypothetical protein [Acidocella sp. KAb 2-4]
MVYTLGQAANATGKSKSTILKAIKNGRISAKKDDLGNWSIDPAELSRVFEVTVLSNTKSNESEHPSNTSRTPSEAIEIAHLKALLEAQRALLAEKDARIADLRQAMTLLAAPKDKAPEPPRSRSLWAKLTGG